MFVKKTHNRYNLVWLVIECELNLEAIVILLQITLNAAKKNPLSFKRDNWFFIQLCSANRDSQPSVCYSQCIRWKRPLLQGTKDLVLKEKCYLYSYLN